MATTFSGTYIGTAGSHTIAAGVGLKLTRPNVGYTLASSGIAEGGAGYSFSGYFNHPISEIAAPGAVGVDLIAGGSMTNFGKIVGGNGGRGVQSKVAMEDGVGGTGGVGIRFAAGGSLVNLGNIDGGDGGQGENGQLDTGGAGGISVDFAGSARVVNDGRIAGGDGGEGGAGFYPPYRAGYGGAGGVGIYFAASSALANVGTIAGGLGGVGGNLAYGGGAGGVGVEMKAGGLIANTAVIAGGAGGEGAYGSDGGAGGNGIDLLNGGIVLNSGTINGGNGGIGRAGGVNGIFGDNGGNGGRGIAAASGGVVINTGDITGGNGGTDVGHAVFNSVNQGGNGVSLGTGGLLVNFGNIAGDDFGVVGAAGVVIAGGVIPDINFGSITGGYGSGITNRMGGAGVEMLKAGSFINFGTIAAGIGESNYGTNYGIGIYLAGGSTLTNMGTIISGAGGYGIAVDFGAAGSSRLIIGASTKFNGAVVAHGSGNVLELAGHQFGTISGVGNPFVASVLNYGFYGFQTIEVDRHSSWAINGTVANILNNGLVEVASGNSLEVTSAVNAASTGIFELTGKGSLEIASLLGSQVKIQFLGGSPDNMLTIDQPADFGLHAGSAAYAGPLLEGFSAGDIIDLKGVGSNGLKLNYSRTTGDLQITASGGGIVASLQFQNASLGPGSFHLATDHAGGVLLSL